MILCLTRITCDSPVCEGKTDDSLHDPSREITGSEVTLKNKFSKQSYIPSQWQ